MPRPPSVPARLAATVVVAVGVSLLPSGSHAAPGAPFTPPRNRAEWDNRREPLRQAVERELAPRLRTLRAVSLEVTDRRTDGNITIESVRLDGGPAGVFVWPAGATADHRVPLVMMALGGGLGGSQKAQLVADGPGFDGPADARVLAGLGFATLALDGDSPTVWRMALDAALARPEVDADRVAVIGLGPGGPTALALLAVDERVRVGVVAVEAATIRRTDQEVFAVSDRDPSSVPANWAEAMVSLCAPKPLALIVGEAIPFRPDSIGKKVERAAKGTYKVASASGTGLSFTHAGEFPGHDSASTRLQWIAALEHLDKTFRPQGPTPLGHDPEPEPELGRDALALTETGLAGWVAEMSQRPGTWTWTDGVVRCQPGPNEYGWLRAPVEVGDFLLQLEWRVPKKGNAGIFLRARPVPWEVAPGEPAKPRVGAMGLDWPSRSGLELQAQDDPGSANRYSSGSLYRHAAPASNPTHPPGGEWNRYTVRARGPRFEVWTNGTQVLDARIDQVPETLPHPPMRGYIGLQNHGAPAEYRNVRLVRLPDAAAISGDGRGQ